MDTAIIFGLIFWETGAFATQSLKTKWKLPFLTTLIMKRPKWQRWAFIGMFSLTLADHFSLAPVPVL